MRAATLVAWVLLAVSVEAASVFVYDHDDGAVVFDPLGAGMVGTEFAMVRALEALGHQVTSSTVLPPDLTPYDAVFVLTAWSTG